MSQENIIIASVAALFLSASSTFASDSSEQNRFQDYSECPSMEFLRLEDDGLKAIFRACHQAYTVHGFLDIEYHDYLEYGETKLKSVHVLNVDIPEDNPDYTAFKEAKSAILMHFAPNYFKLQ